ncbi:TMEM175 family protein [Jatrophihabitans fulvus]
MTTGEPAPAGDLLTLSTTRVEAFSDGVIAIAATLLVLEIETPKEGDDVWGFLGRQLPSLGAYVVSFLTILILWVNHHALFHAVRRVSRPMLFVNGALLLVIAVISYATAVLDHALQAAHYERSAAVFYALVLGAASCCFVALWWALDRSPELLTPEARPRVAAALRRSVVGPALYAVAALAALVDARVSVGIAAAVAVYFAVLPRHLRRGRVGPT